MGKRGPKPSGGYGDKTAVLSTRITAPLRTALEKAAATSGRSLSSEVEHRMRRSFDDDRIIDQLGGPQLYAMLRTISATMQMAGTGWVSAAVNRNRQHTDWLNDPSAYDQAVKSTMTVLDALRPPSGPNRETKSRTVKERRNTTNTQKPLKKFSDILAHIERNWGQHAANLFLRELSNADPTQPLPQENLKPFDKLARRIANGLGGAHARLKKGSNK